MIIKVAIVVLFLDNYEVTRECLESVMSLRYRDFEVIVVNNGPPDDPRARLEAEFPSCTFIDTGSNLGYSGGNNIGIEVAMGLGADFVWVLNNDTIVDPDALDRLAEAAAEHLEAGILNPKTYYHARPDRLVFGNIKWNSWKSIPKIIGEGEVDRGQYDYPHEMDVADGASLFIRSELIKEIGVFDEWFFCYFEDSDLSFRARKSGWRILFVPGARIWHRVSHTSGAGSPVTNYYATRNSMRCVWKNYPAYLPAVFVWGISHHAIKCLVRKRPAHFIMGMRGYFDFFQNKGGKM